MKDSAEYEIGWLTVPVASCGEMMYGMRPSAVIEPTSQRTAATAIFCSSASAPWLASSSSTSPQLPVVAVEIV